MSMYWVAKNGESTGPYAEGRLITMWESGDIGPDDMLALHGTEDWFSADAILPGLIEDRRALNPVSSAGKKKSARRKLKQSGFGLGLVMVILGVFCLIVVNWILGIVFIVVGALINRVYVVCGACGNRVEKGATLCPACRVELTR